MHDLGSGVKVFAGQRADGFYVDLGSIFDLGDLRPFEELHAQYGLNVFHRPAHGINAVNHHNVHSLAIQVPITTLITGSSHPTIGVWTTASRPQAEIWDEDTGQTVTSGMLRQVSRLGNPLVNEVLIPMGKKDIWNTQAPSGDSAYVSYFAQPGLAALLPQLYPHVFPHLQALVNSAKPRADIEAILLTGIPSGIIPGFTNYTGSTPADMLRLNTSIAPTPVDKASIYGLLGNDLAGFPNGRRVWDDVVTIELRALAGATYALVAPTYKPDKAASEVTDGLTPRSVSAGYLNQFPYLGTPYSGFYTHERGTGGAVRAGHGGHGAGRRHRRPGPVHAVQPGWPRNRYQPGRPSGCPAYAFPGPGPPHG